MSHHDLKFVVLDFGVHMAIVFGILCSFTVYTPAFCSMLEIAWRRLNIGLVSQMVAGIADSCTKIRITK